MATISRGIENIVGEVEQPRENYPSSFSIQKDNTSNIDVKSDPDYLTVTDLESTLNNIRRKFSSSGDRFEMGRNRLNDATGKGNLYIHILYRKGTDEVLGTVVQPEGKSTSFSLTIPSKPSLNKLIRKITGLGKHDAPILLCEGSVPPNRSNKSEQYWENLKTPAQYLKELFPCLKSDAVDSPAYFMFVLDMICGGHFDVLEKWLDSKRYAPKVRDYYQKLIDGDGDPLRLETREFSEEEENYYKPHAALRK